MTNIMLVDDHKVFRDCLKYYLQNTGEYNICYEANDGIDAFNILTSGNSLPDVIITDINMPGLSGLDFVQLLKDNNIFVQVIVLSSCDNIEYLDKAIGLGINAYINKKSGIDELIYTISSVMNGGSHIQASLYDQLKEYRDSKLHSDYNIQLSSKENEILKYMSEGLSNKDIAEALNISERTVKNHCVNIFKKLSVSNRTQAILKYINKN